MLNDRPMTGRLVLDLTQGIAGPYAARLMAEHGARVIKIEQPGGDWVRQIGGGPGGTSVNYLYYNFGKENIALDLKSETGRKAALAIAARADVVMESARPGVTARRGLGFDDIRAINPGIVYLSVSGYGQKGPKGPDPMTDTIGQAYTGMMSVNLGIDGVPHKIQTTIIDAITGLYGFQAVAMALMAGGPEARHIDISLMQSAAAIMGPKVMEFAHFGHTPASPNPPAGSYRTSDGWVAITLVKEAGFADLARALGCPDLPDDPRFADFAARLEHLDALVDIMKPILEQKTTDEWVSLFTDHGVLASRINDFGDWLAERQAVETLGAPAMDVLSGVAAPVARTPGRVPFEERCAATGEHTEKVLAEFGLT